MACCRSPTHSPTRVQIAFANISRGTDPVLDSGLLFDVDTRRILGYGDDLGTYTVTYSATSADASPDAFVGQREFEIKVVEAKSAPTPTDGTITEVAVGNDTDAPERTIGGVTRVHVNEGQLTTASVTVEWNHQQVTALWTGHTPANPPPPATVDIEVRHATDSAAWISPAETNESPGTGANRGYDAVLATNRVEIKIPDKPKPTERPDSTSVFRSKTGSVALSLSQDVDAEDEGFRIHVVVGTSSNVSTDTPRGGLMTDRMIVIDDDEVQGVTLSRDPASTAAIFEGGSVTFKAVAEPAREDLDLQVRYNVTTLDGVSVSSRLYTLDSSIGVIPVGSGPLDKDTVKFTSPKNDGDREDDEFTIHAEVVSFDLASGAFDDIDSSTVDFTVLDTDKLPELRVTTTSMEGMVTEGGSIMVEMEIDRNPATTRRIGSEKVDVTSEALTVMLSMGAGSTASESDYQIMTNPVAVPKHDGKAPWVQPVSVEVMALPDDELDDMEVLVLDAEVNGTDATAGPNSADDSYAGVSMLTIEESTAKLVWAKTEDEVYAVLTAAKEEGLGADMTFNPGEMIEVMGSALFNAAEGVTLSFTADSDDDGVASTSITNGAVMVMAEDMAGMAHITVTAHASLPSGVMILDQSDPREASILFPVEVGLEALSIMLSGPEDMNLVEGDMMGAMVTAMANRAVTEVVTVTLMRDRAASTAGDDDYMAEAITIEAGMMTGTTMVMAVEDNMAEEMEALVLYGMAAGNAGEVTGQVELYLWDAAVPALPLIAQLLLGMFLAIGGYRRYLRR